MLEIVTKFFLRDAWEEIFFGKYPVSQNSFKIATDLFATAGDLNESKISWKSRIWGMLTIVRRSAFLFSATKFLQTSLDGKFYDYYPLAELGNN